MEKTIKKLMAILLSICMLMTIFIPYRIEASQTTTKQNKTEVHPLELDNYIQAVTIEYQSGKIGSRLQMTRKIFRQMQELRSQ